MSVSDYPMETNGGGQEDMDRLSMRPADVDADIREMARRKRVDAILTSKTFKAELDRLVEAGLIEGNSVGGCLEQISDMMGMVRGGIAPSAKGSQCVQPIADLRGVDASQFSQQEKVTRCKLASLVRVIDLLGCSGVRDHVVLRMEDASDAVLVNPLGLRHTELTAAGVARIRLPTAAVLHPGVCALGVDARALRRLHVAALAGRPQLRCVLHVRGAASITGVSALKQGLLVLSQHAAVLGPVVRVAPPMDEAGVEITRQLQQQPEVRVLLLQNSGALVCGDTLEEAFFMLLNLLSACEVQMRMMPLGVQSLRVMSDEEQSSAYSEARQLTAVPSRGSVSSGGEPSSPGTPTEWGLGEMEFEAMMRVLDSAGYRTAHLYRCPLHAATLSTANNGRAGLHHHELDESAHVFSPSRKILAGARAGERNRWLGTNPPHFQEPTEQV